MSQPTLVIGNYNYSTWSMRPWLLLAGFDIPFFTEVESLRSDNLTARLKTYSPSGRVPVLVDGETCVWDSLAICEYASEKWLDGQGWPSNPVARAYARSVAAEMHAGFAALRSEMPMNIRARRKITPSAACLNDIDRITEIWREGLQRFGADGDYLAGPFSIADCMYAPVVMRFGTYGVPLNDEAAAYAERMREHPAVQTWVKRALQETEIVDEDEAGEPVD